MLRTALACFLCSRSTVILAGVRVRPVRAWPFRAWPDRRQWRRRGAFTLATPARWLGLRRSGPSRQPHAHTTRGAHRSSAFRRALSLLGPGVRPGCPGRRPRDLHLVRPPPSCCWPYLGSIGQPRTQPPPRFQGDRMLTQSALPREICAQLNCAPAYYQGRPATLWMAVMRHPAMRTGGRATTSAPSRLPKADKTVPPTPRLSAVPWTRRSRYSGSAPRLARSD